MDQQFMGLNTRALLISAGIAGLLMGLFSNLPIIACLNCLLYAWVWGGGIFAVFLYRRSQKGMPLTVVQGLVIGAATGIVGAIIGGVASLIFGGLSAAFSALVLNAAGDLGNTVRDLVVSSGFSFFGIIRDIFVYGIVGAIGGLIATALIWKTPTPPLPPYTPPPSAPTI